MKRLHVRDRLMNSHDACTNGASRVLTAVSFQRWKLEALIPAPADCEVRSVIKCLYAQSIAPIEIHRHLFLVHDHTRLHVNTSPAGFGWEVFNHNPPYSPDLAPSDFHLFLNLNKFLSGQRQRFQNDREAEMSVTVTPNPCGRFLRRKI